MSPEVQKIYENAARSIENELRNQAPSSRIAGGTTVVVVYEGDNVEFKTVLAEDVEYGWYLDKGTGKEASKGEPGNWNPNPGRGDDGIKPRFWTSLSDTFVERIDMMVEEALIDAKDREFEEQMEQI